MIIIFLFSNQKSQDSKKLSNDLITKTIEKVYKLKHEELTDNKKKELKKRYSHITRKMAHIILYLILGIITSKILIERCFSLKEIIIYSLLICIAYAITDEIHQIFINGRSGNIKDVLIDTCGSLLGIILNTIINRKNII